MWIYKNDKPKPRDDGDTIAIEETIEESIRVRRKLEYLEELAFYGRDWLESFKQAEKIFKWIELDYILGRA